MQSLILIVRDTLGVNMAGPAIRYWEMAKALSKEYSVYILAHEPGELSHPGVTLLRYNSATLQSLLTHASGVISQVYNPIETILIKRAQVPLILDAYDPIPIEQLEMLKDYSLEERERHNAKATESLLFSMQAADFILCASDRQKDLWTGVLLSLGKITPNRYDQDVNLDRLIGIVPFGISSKHPEKTGPGLKEKWHFRDKDKLFLWGGGVWNWFDPLSLIKAIADLRQKRDDIHLVFMGLKHPNKAVPEMKMTAEAIALSNSLHLTDRAIHFNFGWTPYEERQNMLLDASAGVSMHFDNIETRFSFRTRLLDCLWAKTPIISTEGDYFADLIKREELGIVVKPQDTVGIADAIQTMADRQDLIEHFRGNINRIRDRFTWEKAVEPIKNFIARKDKSVSKLGWMPYLHFSKAILREKGFTGVAKTILNKLVLNR